MTAQAVQNVRSRHEWSEIINSDWRKSIDSIIQTGRDLAAARKELPRGEFGKIIKADLPFAKTTADKLMLIAGHLAITSDPAPGHLPSSWAVLSELTSLSMDQTPIMN